MILRTILWIGGFMICSYSVGLLAGEGFVFNSGDVFPELNLIQEIDCSLDNSDLEFKEFPLSATEIQEISGIKCRVLKKSDSCSYFAYRIGRGKGLKAGAPYVLNIEFPDDLPRAYFICNWGFETVAGDRTGATVGDALNGRYTNSSPESLQIPQSGKFLQWKQYFHLYDRFPDIKRARGLAERPFTPEDGFWVIVAQLQNFNDPLSNGAAVSKIRLYEVANPEKIRLKINYPPEPLPKRYIFFREEMADGVIAYGHKPEEKKEELRGLKDRVKFYEYKINQMKMLGINTFCKDLLEFGHNQGWDSSKYGGSAWYNQSSDPSFWERIINMISLTHKDLFILPYYEYAGSIGQDEKLAIGRQRRCKNLQGENDYTHIKWVHKTNADICDPDFIEDASKVLELTMTQYKDKVNFIGAWFRPRPEANPISFNEKDLELFSKETKGGKKVSRTDLQGNKKLLEDYYTWWYRKRRNFNIAIRDYLRKNVSPDAILLYTCDASESGYCLQFEKKEIKNILWKWNRVVVTDNTENWENILADLDRKKFSGFGAISYDFVIKNNLYLDALLQPHLTWGKYEWQHACPTNDQQNYKNVDGVMLTYTFNKLFTVSSEKPFNEFKTKSGLAIVRHYFLNENEMVNDGEDILGYFVADVERAGPYSMLAEARAFANGDPRYIGYLYGNSFSRGFPEYVREFNAAFLSLPALPSKKINGACNDNEIVVRAINANEHGMYLGIVNTSLNYKQNIEINLYQKKNFKAFNTVTGKEIETNDGKLFFKNMYPGQLISINIK